MGDELIYFRVIVENMGKISQEHNVKSGIRRLRQENLEFKSSLGYIS
jgi:hypothetical protein